MERKQAQEEELLVLWRQEEGRAAYQNNIVQLLIFGYSQKPISLSPWLFSTFENTSQKNKKWRQMAGAMLWQLQPLL